MAEAAESTGIEMTELEPPPYEEALQMRRLSTPVEEMRRDLSPLITPSPLARRPQFTFDTVPEEEEGETELPGLVSPEPPNYPTNAGTTLFSPESGRPSTVQPLTDRDPDMTHMKEPLCLYLLAGDSGLKLPRMVLDAWRIGLRQIMSTGRMGNCSRYIFLSLQSVLLLSGILLSYFIGFDSDFYRYLRITALGLALMVNFIERFLYWCIHGLSNLNDDGVWNFCGDVARLVLTEMFIYVAFATTLYTTSRTYIDEFIDFPRNSTEYAEFRRHGYSTLGLMAFLFFTTACLMKILSLISITRNLLLARLNKTSNASLSQAVFLNGLRIHTFAHCLLQLLTMAHIGLVFREDDHILLNVTVRFVVLTLAEVVPLMFWGLYFSYALPCGRYFPLSMFLDLPAVSGRRDRINRQAVSSWFQNAHARSMTCNSIFINFLRPLTSPLQYFIHIIFIAATGYVGYFLIYGTYFYGGGMSTRLVIVPTLAAGIMVVFSFPSLLLGLLMILLLPILGPVSLLMCVSKAIM